MNEQIKETLDKAKSMGQCMQIFAVVGYDEKLRVEIALSDLGVAHQVTQVTQGSSQLDDPMFDIYANVETYH